MFILMIAMAGLTGPAPLKSDATAAKAAGCERTKVENVSDAKNPPAKIRKLDRMPTATQEIAVLHLDADGCVKPIVVRQDVGG